MTIIAAVQDPKKLGTFYLAGNTMGVGDGMAVFDEPKWRFFHGRLAVATSGSYRGANVAFNWASAIAAKRSLPAIFDAVNSLRAAFTADGYKDTDETEPEVNFKQSVLLVGRFKGSDPCLVDVTSDFGFVCCPPGEPAFGGSGLAIGQTAWHALVRKTKKPMAPGAALQAAVGSAIDLVVTCPGTLEFHQFEVA